MTETEASWFTFFVVVVGSLVAIVAKVSIDLIKMHFKERHNEND